MLKMLIPKNAFDDGCARTYGIINEICSTCYLPAGPDRKIFSRGFKTAKAASRGTFLRLRENIFLFGMTKVVTVNKAFLFKLLRCCYSYDLIHFIVLKFACRYILKYWIYNNFKDTSEI